MAISPMGLEDPADEVDPAPRRGRAGGGIAGRSPFQLAMEQLRSDRVAMVCVYVIAFFLLVAIFAPLICKAWGVDTHTLSSDDLLSMTNASGMPTVGPPYNGFSWSHPLGLAPITGKDNLAQWVYGARTSISIAVISAVVATLLGIVVGLVSGFSRGWVDNVVSWVIDLFLSLPFLVVALAVTPILVIRFGQNATALEYSQFIALLVILSTFGWMPLARLIRGEVLSLREREFVLAARAIGVPTRTILRKELLPNLVAPIIVSISLGIPAFVSAEAGLAYLGVGVTNMPSWGQQINKGVSYFDTYPLYLWAPVAGLLTLVVALNLLGDSIRDAFDPKTRR
ncbi:MAG: ABC transporter permease [Nocardioidaceae bacterium]